MTAPFCWRIVLSVGGKHRAPIVVAATEREAIERALVIFPGAEVREATSIHQLERESSSGGWQHHVTLDDILARMARQNRARQPAPSIPVALGRA